MQEKLPEIHDESQAYPIHLGYNPTNDRGTFAHPLTQVPLPQTLYPHSSPATKKAIYDGQRAAVNTEWLLYVASPNPNMIKLTRAYSSPLAHENLRRLRRYITKP